MLPMIAKRNAMNQATGVNELYLCWTIQFDLPNLKMEVLQIFHSFIPTETLFCCSLWRMTHIFITSYLASLRR